VALATLRRSDLFTATSTSDDLSIASALRAVESVGRVDLGAALVLSSHSFGCHRALRAFGDQDQRAAWEEALRSGRKIGGYALSEPEAGSDAALVATAVAMHGRQFLLSGRKSFVVNAATADLFVVFAIGAGEDEATRARLSAFLVRGGVKGVIREEAEAGASIIARAGIRTLRFEEVRLERGDLLGAPGDGYRIAQMLLDGVRLAASAAVLGAASGVFDRTVAGLEGKRQFGKAHAEFGMIQDRVGRAAAEIGALRALVGVAARLFEAGSDVGVESAIVRLAAVAGARRAVDSLLDVAGGRGLFGRAAPAAILDDLAAFRFVGGADDLLRFSIALSGGKPVAEFFLRNRASRRGATWLDAVVKGWWRMARLDFGRLRAPRLAPALAVEKELLEEAMTLLANRVHKLHHYAGAEAIEYQIELKRIAEMAVETMTLLALLIRADAGLAGRLPEGEAEAARAALAVHAPRAWKRLIRHSSRFFLSDDAAIVRLSGLDGRTESDA
jgi:alkylation response protein AidB-like acyl-CoA dehydrogenase